MANLNYNLKTNMAAIVNKSYCTPYPPFLSSLRKDPGNEVEFEPLCTKPQASCLPLVRFRCRTLPLMKLKRFRIPVQFSCNNIKVMSKLKVCHSSKICNKYHMHIAFEKQNEDDVSHHICSQVNINIYTNEIY